MKEMSASRRKFLKESIRNLGGLSCIGLLLGLQQHQSLAQQNVVLRPPFALDDEKQFNAACIRCGQCVQACPYDILHLAGLLSPLPAGTPFFTARSKPCEMCEDIPCAKACPSGALDSKAEDITQSRMGLAVLLDHETCLNWQGLRCDVCYRVCPLIDKAITLETHRNERTNKHAVFIPTVHSESCTGCGKCEESCVLEESAIKVMPMSLAKGKIGKHYRLGWEEKAKAGHSLSPDDIISLPVRRPENL